MIRKTCEYLPGIQEYVWRLETGERYYPKPDESPTWYLMHGVRYYSESELKRQGLTPKQIRDRLGEPDKTTPNPRYWSASRMKLYRVDRAEQVLNELIAF